MMLGLWLLWGKTGWSLRVKRSLVLMELSLNERKVIDADSLGIKCRSSRKIIYIAVLKN